MTPDTRPARMALARHAAVWLGAGLAVAVATASLLWWTLGAPDLTGPGALRAQDKFDLVKIALTVTGGIGGVVFLVIAYRKQQLTESAERREDNKAFAERFAKAAEQLGHEAAAVRLAGVYAVAGLADDLPNHRQTCVDVLCAYLRMHYDPAAPDDQAARKQWHGERQVRHTIIRVISRHLTKQATLSWRDCALDFSGAVLDDADFRNAEFAEAVVSFRGTVFCAREPAKVDFGGATFSGAAVDFADACFTGPVSFRDVEFAAGDLSFRGVLLDGGGLWFANASFSGGKLDFTDARFRQGTISFRSAVFAGGSVDMRSLSEMTVRPLYDQQPDGPPTGLLIKLQT